MTNYAEFCCRNISTHPLNVWSQNRILSTKGLLAAAAWHKAKGQQGTKDTHPAQQNVLREGWLVGRNNCEII